MMFDGKMRRFRRIMWDQTWRSLFILRTWLQIRRFEGVNMSRLAPLSFFLSWSLILIYTSFRIIICYFIHIFFIAYINLFPLLWSHFEVLIYASFRIIVYYFNHIFFYCLYRLTSFAFVSFASSWSLFAFIMIYLCVYFIAHFDLLSSSYSCFSSLTYKFPRFSHVGMSSL